MGFLTDDQLRNSYSTYIGTNIAGEPVEIIYRIRETTEVRSLAKDLDGNVKMVNGEPVQLVDKFWAVLTHEGNIEGFSLDEVVQAND